MDIVYVIGRGSRYDNLELRWSLRSITKFGTNIGNVIVVGFPPDWLSDRVIKVSVKDKYSYKHSNILRCLEEVVDKKIVSGDFLYSSDDHFYVKQTDFNHYPYYIKSLHLRTLVPIGDRYKKYHTSLKDTGELLRRHNLPDANYAQHANTHMNADVINEYRNLIYESYAMPYGAEPTSLLMNAWQTKPNAPSCEYRQDIKISMVENLRDFLTRIGQRECFSVGDGIFEHKHIMQYLKNLYSEKSPYEK